MALTSGSFNLPGRPPEAVGVYETSHRQSMKTLKVFGPLSSLLPPSACFDGGFGFRTRESSLIPATADSGEPEAEASFVTDRSQRTGPLT
jgi:hypothetical protein